MKEEVYVRRHKDVLYEKAGMVMASPASTQPGEDSAWCYEEVYVGEGT